MKYEAKQLEKLIVDYITESVKGSIPNLQKNKFNLIAERTLSDPEAPELANAVVNMFGGDGIFQMMAAWDYRDQVNKFQVENNISSVYFENHTWNGETIEIATFSDQLTLLDEDIEICKRYKEQVGNWFFDFCIKHDLFCFDTNNDGEPIGEPVSIKLLRSTLEQSEHVIPLAVEKGFSRDFCFFEYTFVFIESLADYREEDRGRYILATPINWAIH